MNFLQLTCGVKGTEELPLKSLVMVCLWMGWPVPQCSCLHNWGRRTRYRQDPQGCQLPNFRGLFYHCWGWLLLHHIKPLFLSIWEFTLTHFLWFCCWVWTKYIACILTVGQSHYLWCPEMINLLPTRWLTILSIQTPLNLMHSPVINNENKSSQYHTEHLRWQKLPQIPTWKAPGLKNNKILYSL